VELCVRESNLALMEVRVRGMDGIERWTARVIEDIRYVGMKRKESYSVVASMVHLSSVIRHRMWFVVVVVRLSTCRICRMEVSGVGCQGQASSHCSIH
jgi:hypothetical protein